MSNSFEPPLVDHLDHPEDLLLADDGRGEERAHLVADRRGDPP